MVNSLENIDKSKVYVDRIEGLDEEISSIIDNTLTGAVSTITTSDLTAGKVLVSDNNGKVAAGSDALSDLAHKSVIATGSTESRLITDRFADIVNVKDFGAVGDGATDDTSAINAAFIRAYTNNTSIYFPDGVYNTTNSINYFSEIKKFGTGEIKRGTSIYHITNKNNTTNYIYVSTNGIGDGLSVSYPTDITTAIQLLQTEGILFGNWNIKLSAGEYPGGITFSGFKVIESLGLSIIGADISNNIWTTKVVLPSGSDKNACLSFFGTENIFIKNIWCDSNHDTSDTHGIYFQTCGGKNRVDTCYITNARGGGIASQESSLVQVKNCTIDCDTNNTYNYGYGIYAYHTVVSTLFSGTRNTIRNCQRGIFATGNSYIHNDFNDFYNCKYSIFCDKNSYCGYNDCSSTNHGRLIYCYGDSVVNLDNSNSITQNTDRLYCFGNLRINNSNYVKQGFYNPDRGQNGVWGFGFSDWAPVGNLATFNLSTNGEACTQTSNIDSRGILVQSKDTKAGLYLLSDASSVATGPRITFYDESNTYPRFSTIYGGGMLQIYFGANNRYYRIYDNAIYPENTGQQNLGSASFLWKEIFAAVGTINTSDERQKQDIAPVDEAVFRAWSKVNFIQYKFKDAVAKKGEENARIHFGVIAQRVKEAFESEGLDAFKYGLLCYDEWEAEPEEKDEEGNVVNPGHEAGNAYGIRYAEALALECAYQRWKLEQVENKLNSL